MTTQTDALIEFTDAGFEAEVLRSDQPVLVDISADWCAPCRQLAPTIEELAREYQGKATIGKLDADENREMPARYGVQALPTILLFKDGELRERFVGLTRKMDLKEALDRYLA